MSGDDSKKTFSPTIGGLAGAFSPLQVEFLHFWCFWATNQVTNVAEQLMAIGRDEGTGVVGGGGVCNPDSNELLGLEAG
jgi:hypothetical protein